MSDYFSTMRRLGALPSGFLASTTLMGGAFRDVPSLPLASRYIVLPAPTVIRRRETVKDVGTSLVSALPAARVREFRTLVTALRRERRSLDGWDATLVAELARWRRPPSEWEAQQVALLAERMFWAARDGVASC